jgi:hypothetical protein
MTKGDILRNISGCLKYDDRNTIREWLLRAESSLGTKDLEALLVDVLDLAEDKVEDPRWSQLAFEILDQLQIINPSEDSSRRRHFDPKLDSFLCQQQLLQEERERTAAKEKKDRLFAEEEAKRIRLQEEALSRAEEYLRSRGVGTEGMAAAAILDLVPHEKRKEDHERAAIQCENFYRKQVADARSYLVSKGAVVEGRFDEELLRDANRLRLCERHAEFLASRGISVKGRDIVRGSAVRGTRPRLTHCYNCKILLNNSLHWECDRCSWIVCPGCGACGCGYEKNI